MLVILTFFPSGTRAALKYSSISQRSSSLGIPSATERFRVWDFHFQWGIPTTMVPPQSFLNQRQLLFETLHLGLQGICQRAHVCHDISVLLVSLCRKLLKVVLHCLNRKSHMIQSFCQRLGLFPLWRSNQILKSSIPSPCSQPSDLRMQPASEQ